MKTLMELNVINYKWNAFSEKSAVLDKERSKMAEIREPFWQTDSCKDRERPEIQNARSIG